jgi:mannan endo-1,4-beta-mannosidase
MRSRLTMILAVVLALAAVAGASYRLKDATPPPSPPAHASLAASLASYLGAFEPGAPPGYGPIADFTQAAGRQPNLIGYYSGWAEPFDTSFAGMLRTHGIIPFVQIDPTDALISGIADGIYDPYLRSYAESVRDFRTNVVIGFGHEMNAPWYLWGYKHVPPATFVAAWRHIVTLFNEQGAENVTWLWTVQADEPGTGPVDLWWPGSQYVKWVGIDGYYTQPSDTFNTVFAKTIDQIRNFTDNKKPVLLSETAVGQDVNAVIKIHDLFTGMIAYKTLGLVWFDVAQHGSLIHQDWRLEDSQLAEIAFALAARNDMAATLPTG